MYDADNSLYYSFTSDKNGFWNRKLDYIFSNGNFVANSGMVHQDETTGGMKTMPLSDHAPITVLFVK
jgi:endonuclease/exonuclease/phosphatase family metal-dependent hydrolase